TAGRAQRELRVDVEPPGDVDDREQQVTDLAERLVSRLGLGCGSPCERDRVLELGELLPDLRQRACDVRPVVTDRGRAPLHLSRVKQGGQRSRHVVENTLTSLLLGLDRLPAQAHGTGAICFRPAEDMRVTANELLVRVSGDGFEISLALLLQEQGQEVDLEEQVAQLVEELPARPGPGCVRDLVRLFDGVRDDGAGRLLAVPRALEAQAPRQLLQIDERLFERHPRPTGSWSPRWSRSRPAARSRSRT